VKTELIHLLLVCPCSVIGTLDGLFVYVIGEHVYWMLLVSMYVVWAFWMGLLCMLLVSMYVVWAFWMGLLCMLLVSMYIGCYW